MLGKRRRRVVALTRPFLYYRPNMDSTRSWWRQWGWLLLALTTAVFLRLHALTDVPPGLTHDEADHGLTAWRILAEGARDLYFTIGYGREPLYDYLTAGLMALIGRTYVAGRLTAVFASLLLVAAMYTWSRLAFNRRVALLTMAGTAVGFWPVMSGRQMLRSTLLPTLFALALCCFWYGWRRLEMGGWQIALKSQPARSLWRSPLLQFWAAGVLLGLCFYVYIPARALWGVFPALLLWLAVADRPRLRQVWPGVALLLLTAVLVALPLFRYLALYGEVEARLQELSAPLQAMADGDWRPIWQNTLASLRLFTVQGDLTWRYNVAGRPWLNPVLGVLFYGGVAVSVLRIAYYVLRITTPNARRPTPDASFFALAWLLAGLSPVLVTGPALSMTQAIGMQPLLYLFAALGLDALARLWQRATERRPTSRRPHWQFFIPLLLFSGTAVITYHDYFVVWANAPEVRVQYESTMMTMLDYVAAHDVEMAAISTITPGWAHSPAAALMALPAGHDVHWFDGRSSLLLPDAPQATWLFPGFATLPEALRPYLAAAVLHDILPLRDTDLDRPVTIYRAETVEIRAAWSAQFTPLGGAPVVGEALTLLGFDLRPPQPRPGDWVSVATLWQVERPLAQAQMFVHIWDGAGRPLAQADLLGVPADQWRVGDWFVQLHQFTLPPETAVGAYPLVVGLYDPATEQRFPITQNGESAVAAIFLTTLQVEP